MADPTSRADDDLDPEDFLRALLKITPEDAAEAREDATTAAEPALRREREQRG